MDLQLGLALPNSDHFLKKLELVRKSCSFDGFGEGYGSSLSSDDDDCPYDDDYYGMKRKRARLSEDIVGDYACLPKTLPLLLWSKEPNGHDDDDDDDQEIHKCGHFSTSRNGREDETLVGWPPIQSYRKRRRGQNNVVRPNNPMGNENGRGGYVGDDDDNRWSSRYVKVQMEGMVITRKISLSFLRRHQSYEGLTHSLISLFGKGQDIVEDYRLTYQDREGDWMLAGDVPWRVFIRSIQRLKLLKDN
ncbi:Auxin-responsive protein IAA13-like protein [Drosera capensis]